MLNYVKGRVLSVEEHLSIVLDAIQLGFCVHVLNLATYSVGEIVELHVYTHWNQEQGPSLYGFKLIQERNLFALINGCSGIGPKMALTILSQIDVNSFVCAIQSGDIKVLSQLKGIGAKKAEQLVLHLKNKIDQFIMANQITAVGVAKYLGQISDVLCSLNYSQGEVQRTVHYLGSRKFDSEPSFDQVMRCALSFLAKKV